MRRIVMMGALVALMVAMFATAAFAANVIYCSTNPCNGTQERDTMFDGWTGSTEEVINAGRGNDHVNADYYWYDAEEVNGNRGSDFLDSQDEDTLDEVNGGPGINDVCEIDRNADTGDRDATTGCESVRVSNYDL